MLCKENAFSRILPYFGSRKCPIMHKYIANVHNFATFTCVFYTFILLLLVGGSLFYLLFRGDIIVEYIHLFGA